MKFSNILSNIEAKSQYLMIIIQEIYNQQSTVMEKIYDLIQSIIKDANLAVLPELFQSVQSQQNAELGTLFGLPTNIQYIFKRLINACLSTDSIIRDNSATALSEFRKLYTESIDVEKMLTFVLYASNYKKKANHKKNQTQGFAIGRLNIFKSLSDVFNNNSSAFTAAKEVMADFPHLQETAIQVLFIISNNKLLKMKFMDLSPKNSSARFLYRMMIHQKWPSEENVSLEEGQELIKEQIQKFPQRSIGIEYFGKYLANITETPASFFAKYANKFLDEEEEVEIHEIYYILVVLKQFLKSVIIDKNNVGTYFQNRIIAVWLQQLRVLNKKMKGLAKQISVTFDNDAEMAYKILVSLHESDIYLDNISHKHPLASLYENVDTEKYWEYLYGICEEQFNDQKQRCKKERKASEGKVQEIEENQNIEIQEEETKFTNFHQLCFILQHYHDRLSDQKLISSLALLLNLYHLTNSNRQNSTTSSKTYLFILTDIFNHLFESASKKKKKSPTKITIKLLNLLSKMKWESLTQITDEESKSSMRDCVKWVKKQIIKEKKVDSELTPAQISFYNFYISLLFFVLMYPDEVETCNQLKMVQEDLKKISSGEQSKPRKKSKKMKEEEDDIKKPIHVLIDIFISLMTKPPKFLRKSIHQAYEQIIPLLDESDLGNLLTVVTTPDAQFIQEM